MGTLKHMQILSKKELAQPFGLKKLAKELQEFLKDKERRPYEIMGVMNANDLGIVSNALKISTNGKHIVGWTAVDGYLASFKLTLDQLHVCKKGKTMQVGYPGAVAAQLKRGATLGMCEADLPLQYKGNN